jgi:hypothetical protein
MYFIVFSIFIFGFNSFAQSYFEVKSDEKEPLKLSNSFWSDLKFTSKVSFINGKTKIQIAPKAGVFTIVLEFPGDNTGEYSSKNVKYSEISKFGSYEYVSSDSRCYFKLRITKYDLGVGLIEGSFKGYVRMDNSITDITYYKSVSGRFSLEK